MIFKALQLGGSSVPFITVGAETAPAKPLYAVFCLQSVEHFIDILFTATTQSGKWGKKWSSVRIDYIVNLLFFPDMEY